MLFTLNKITYLLTSVHYIQYHCSTTGWVSVSVGNRESGTFLTDTVSLDETRLPVSKDPVGSGGP